MSESPWSHLLPWATLRSGGNLTLEADAATRARIADFLGLEGLARLTAALNYRPWLDGAEVSGRLTGAATRTCGVTLDPLEEKIDESFDLRVVPEGSANAPAAEAELTISLEEEDPPDTAPAPGVDLGDYVVEALALALDPFPRKAGAELDLPLSSASISPFAALKSLKTGG